MRDSPICSEPSFTIIEGDKPPFVVEESYQPHPSILVRDMIIPYTLSLSSLHIAFDMQG
jgi:hypothetical protein